MKLTLERDALVNALAHVVGAVERKTTIPILSCLRLSASGGALDITATNLDVEATASAKAEITAPGAVAVPADVLGGFARKLPSGAAVALEQGDGKVVVTSGRSRLTIPLFPAAAFPVMEDGSSPLSFTLPAPVLSRMLAQTRFACSTAETRYYLCGVLMHVRQTDAAARLACVATDGHRLAYADTDPPESLTGKALNAIVPRHTAALIAKLLADDLGECEVAFSPSHIIVRAAAGVLKSKLIDGSFPDYERIIPSEAPHTLRLARAAAVEALSRVMIVADERARAVRLCVSAEQLTFRVRNIDRGEACEDLAAAFDGPALDLGFNGKLLADALGQSAGEDVTFALGAAGAPALVRDPSAPDAFSVLMPLRV